MGAAYITFTDDTGAAQLDNGMTSGAGAVGSHFKNWLSESVPIGASAVSLGTGARSMFTFRTDYKASFDLTDIPNANVAILDRLINWLLRGGTCAVYTGDTSAHTYATCGLAEGTTPSKALDNRNDITWTLKVALVNLGAASALTCTYES